MDFLRFVMSRTWISISKMLRACPVHSCLTRKCYIINIGWAWYKDVTDDVRRYGVIFLGFQMLQRQGAMWSNVLLPLKMVCRCICYLVLVLYAVISTVTHDSYAIISDDFVSCSLCPGFTCPCPHLRGPKTAHVEDMSSGVLDMSEPQTCPGILSSKGEKGQAIQDMCNQVEIVINFCKCTILTATPWDFIALSIAAGQTLLVLTPTTNWAA